jgi:hypothetical protein
MSKLISFTKRGFYIVDSDNNVILNEQHMPLIFKTKEAAEEYCAQNNIIGTVK